MAGALDFTKALPTTIDGLEDGPTFFGRPLTAKQAAEAADLLAQGRIGSYAVFVVRSCLDGWRDFYSSDGTAVAFVKGAGDYRASEESVDRIPHAWRQELAREWWNHSRLPSQVKKK